MNRYLRKTTAGMLVIAMALLLCPMRAYAAGKVSIKADKESAAVGDTLTVEVSADAGNGDMAPSISVSYDRNRLSFTSCSVEYGGGEGGLITLTDTSAEISFTILSGGAAEVTVEGEIDGEAVSPESVSVSVDGEDTAAAMGSSSSTETGVEAGSISSSDGQGLISTVFADEFMPVLFHKTTASYEEQMVEAAQFDMGDILLLYVTDESGNNGSFKIYDQASGSLSDFLAIQGIENRFIIVLKADESASVPEGFTKAVLQWNNDKQLEAYVMTDAITAEGTSSSDFFLLYAMSSEGNKGWYMYDQAEGTYQRYVSTGQKGSGTDDDGGILSSLSGSGSESNGFGTKDIIMIVMGALLLIFLVLMIIMFVKLRDYQSYEYIDEEDYEEGAYERAENNGGNETLSGRREYRAEDIEKPADSDNIDSRDEISDMEFEDIEDEEGPGNKKLTAGDLVRRQMSDEEPEDDDDYFAPRRMTREEKKQEKARLKAEKKERKKLEREYGENGPVDWAELENTLKEAGDDDRRPRGNMSADMETRSVPEREVKRERENELLRQAEHYQKPVYRESIQQPVYQQPMQQAERYQQPMYQQPMQQAERYQQPVYQQPSAPAYNPADLDEDFDFEFLNIDP